MRFLGGAKLEIGTSSWVFHGGGEAAREIAKQFTLELALPTPEASPVQGELAVKPPEGLSDKNFLKGVA